MSNATRMGLCLTVLLVSIAAGILGFRETLPPRESLSSHVVTPKSFGEITSKHRAQQDPTFLGYGFVTDKADLPERYDVSTHPWVSEPAAQPPIGGRILIFHPAIKLESRDVETINNLIGKPMKLFFYQGKIASLFINEEAVVDWSRIEAGLSQKRSRSWMWAGGLFLISLLGFFWRNPKV